METKTDIRILIVDDEDDIREILQFNLESEGFVIDTANSAENALKMLDQNYDLILLDVMMGGMSGFKMADQLRKEHNMTPIIFLTAKRTENDMLTGFSIGADDYISKPFSIKEVTARVRSVIKRSQIVLQVGKEESESIAKGGIEVNLISKMVFVDNLEVSLTKTEFNLLVFFLENEGRVFSRAEILSHVWKDESIILERTVDVHIARLRKKMGAYGDKITNRSGHGYVFNLEI